MRKGKWLQVAALFIVLFVSFATGALAVPQDSDSAKSKIYLSHNDCIPNANDQQCGVNLDEYCSVATDEDSPLIGIEHKDPNGKSIFLPRYLHAGELIAINPITGHAMFRLCGNSCSSIRDPLDPSRQSSWLLWPEEGLGCKKKFELGKDPFRNNCVSSFKELVDLLNPGQCLVRLWRPIGPLTLCDTDGNCITDYLRADTDVAIDPIDPNGEPGCRELLFATGCRYKPQKKFCVPRGTFQYVTCTNKPGERNFLEGLILAPGVTDTDLNSINMSIEGTAEGTTHESVDSWEPGFWGGPADVDPDGNPNVHARRQRFSLDLVEFTDVSGTTLIDAHGMSCTNSYMSDNVGSTDIGCGNPNVRCLAKDPNVGGDRKEEVGEDKSVSDKKSFLEYQRMWRAMTLGSVGVSSRSSPLCRVCNCTGEESNPNYTVIDTACIKSIRSVSIEVDETDFGDEEFRFRVKIGVRPFGGAETLFTESQTMSLEGLNRFLEDLGKIYEACQEHDSCIVGKKD